MQTTITKTALTNALRYRHIVVASYREETLCGLLPAYVVDGRELAIDAACDCGHPECELPPTCPVCIAVAKGQVN